MPCCCVAWLLTVLKNGCAVTDRLMSTVLCPGDNYKAFRIRCFNSCSDDMSIKLSDLQIN
jgi:hypothetical protein